ncbi:serine acetyltransferase [Paenibacillus sp. BSR1-1]|uniref:serine O-acetyltransferase n=1 Tax=Paenibacillus sp. BSR1-1 TaxID=3020845 RepID=UPI0025AFD56F|nr:DapH/DapD/GlmU-related protein [Paenibacillus sp. BSR1-1]MDN3019183.1 serine acetyltransferase [Paenibacillus sp. BSR1-1]
MFKKIKRDINVNANITSVIVLCIYRFGNYVYCKFTFPIIKHFLLACYKMLDLLIIKFICNAEIPAKCEIQEGLSLGHGANGLIIHPGAKIGRNVVIYHQVTIGINPGELGKSTKAPVIGDNVFIGAGAKIIGDVSVGNNSIIGANTVIVRDIPPNSTVVGSPARIIEKIK